LDDLHVVVDYVVLVRGEGEVAHGEGVEDIDGVLTEDVG
jgi:hypothetical protein